MSADVNEPLIPQIIASFTYDANGELDCDNDTEEMIHVLVKRYDGKHLAEIIRDNAPLDCDIERLRWLIGILMGGFPGIDDSELTARLHDWVLSPVEAEFRCAIAELHVLYHCEHTVESLEETFGPALEDKWPAYRDRIRKMKTIWLEDLARIRREEEHRSRR